MKKGMVIRTRPIGDVFELRGKKYKVTEKQEEGCMVCDFYEGGPDDPCTAEIEVCGLCYKGMRRDGKGVFFKEVR